MAKACACLYAVRYFIDGFGEWWPRCAATKDWIQYSLRRTDDIRTYHKTRTLNTNCFLIRMLYKDCYWHYLFCPMFSCHINAHLSLLLINEYCIELYCIEQ